MLIKPPGGGVSIDIHNRVILDAMVSVLIRKAKAKFNINLGAGELLYHDDGADKLFIWDRNQPYSEATEPSTEAQSWFQERVTIIREALEV